MVRDGSANESYSASNVVRAKQYAKMAPNHCIGMPLALNLRSCARGTEPFQILLANGHGVRDRGYIVARREDCKPLDFELFLMQQQTLGRMLQLLDLRNRAGHI